MFALIEEFLCIWCAHTADIRGRFADNLQTARATYVANLPCVKHLCSHTGLLPPASHQLRHIKDIIGEGFKILFASSLLWY